MNYFIDQVCGERCENIMNYVKNDLVKDAKGELKKGGGYLVRRGADGVSWLQNNVIGYSAKTITWTFTKLDEAVSGLLTGCKTNPYRASSGLALAAITAACGWQAFKNFGFSLHYLPIPGLRAKKIVTITQVRIPGHDVTVDKVHEDERSLGKTGVHMKKAVFCTIATGLAALGLALQVKEARAQECVVAE